MRYEIDLLASAQRDLNRLPISVRQYAAAQLRNLAEEPSLLSERGDLYYHPYGQVCQFDYDYDGERWHLTVLFAYSGDERRLEIERVRYLRELID